MRKRRTRSRKVRRSARSAADRARAKLSALEEQVAAARREVVAALYGPFVEIDPDSAPLHPLRRAAREFERAYVARVLQATGGNGTEAARVLGVSRSSFYRLLSQHGLQSLIRGRRSE